MALDQINDILHHIGLTAILFWLLAVFFFWAASKQK